MKISETSFSVNGRCYRPPPKPVVAICIDGCADEYLSVSLAKGRMPNLARMTASGYRGLVRAALPTFTNVNNTSIATGVAPDIHGVSGNFFLDPSGEEVMMNSAAYVRCDTIFAAAEKAGRRIACVTAKEKLRDILSKGLQSGIAFSSEKASQAKRDTHGIDDVETLVGEPTPPIYSGDASLFVLKAGVALLQNQLADFLYLSLTDYMQHKFAPEQAESLDFYAAIDHEIGRLIECGAVVAATADHGMNAKNTIDGKPNVIYLEDVLNEQLGPGNRVICPITDPYVVHHGALGSFVTVHLQDPDRTQEIGNWILALPGITEVFDRDMAAKKLELPADRIGELVVMSGRDVVVGRTPKYHDLSQLSGGLRSHGGRYEEMVPLLISQPLNSEYRAKAGGDPRNFEIFDYACNGGL